VRPTLERVLDDLGRRIAELRRGRGWTQAHAAGRAGMQLREYQAVEAGTRNVTLRTALAVANAYGVTMSELFVAPAAREPRHPGRPKAAAESPEGTSRRRAR
jgi:transcriptional regulator with XRE-family HTH domain